MPMISDITFDIKVNRNCGLCCQKVSEVMHSLVAIYCVNFVGKDNIVSLKARGDPSLLMAMIGRYGDHGKIENMKFDGPVENFPSFGGYYGPPQPYGFGGNYGYPMLNQPPTTTTTKKVEEIKYERHTAPPSYYHQPPPPLQLPSYSYVDPPRLPTGKPDGFCVIM